MPDSPHGDRADGPLPMRALTPAERERVIERLGDAFAHDLVALDEYERRVDLAYKASGPAELRALVPRGSNAWAERGRVYVKCPVCETLMNRRQYASGAQVVIDWCKHHGVWFDAGELSRVLDFVATGGLARAQERDAAAESTPERSPEVSA